MDGSKIELTAIGYVSVAEGKVPRSWRSSDLEGDLVINQSYAEGLADIMPGQRLMVVFYFHESDAFTEDFLIQRPGSSNGEERGVFSTLSPVRPNPVGISIVDVLAVDGTTLRVRHLDMRNGTPVLDLKPWRGDVAGAEAFGGWNRRR